MFQLHVYDYQTLAFSQVPSGIALRFTFCIMIVPFGLVVRIPGFHPGGPGSIPGMGTICFFPFLYHTLSTKMKVSGTPKTLPHQNLPSQKSSSNFRSSAKMKTFTSHNNEFLFKAYQTPIFGRLPDHSRKTRCLKCILQLKFYVSISSPVACALWGSDEYLSSVLCLYPILEIVQENLSDSVLTLSLQVCMYIVMKLYEVLTLL